MNKSGGFADKLKTKFRKKQPQSPEQQDYCEDEQERSAFGEVIRVIWLVFYRLRSVFLAIPVVFAALRLAAYNSENLPLLVGIDLQTTGEFAHLISRQSAVMYPLLFTAACLGLMFLSRKPIYPWLISIFSLAVPVLLLVTNMLHV